VVKPPAKRASREVKDGDKKKARAFLDEKREGEKTRRRSRLGEVLDKHSKV